MNLNELDAYVKTVSYDELRKMLSIILAESTKRMSRRAIDGVEGVPNMSDLESRHWCPVCHRIWDKSHRLCPRCPGVLLLRKFAYQFGYSEGFP